MCGVLSEITTVEGGFETCAKSVAASKTAAKLTPEVRDGMWSGLTRIKKNL